MDGDQFLQNLVQDGNVDYGNLQSGDLEQVLQAIAETDLANLHGDDRYAFLINAYNLCTLDAVQQTILKDGKQVRNLNNKLTWLRFFFFTKITVAGQRMSLYKLEFKHIKPLLKKDPRGHFALVCASCGCPPLRGGVYNGNTLDAELDLAGKAFMQPGGGYQWNEATQTLHLNRIFKWYRKDFGNVLEWVHKYADIPDPQHIKYLPYDWNLNTVKR